MVPFRRSTRSSPRTVPRTANCPRNYAPRALCNTSRGRRVPGVTRICSQIRVQARSLPLRASSSARQVRVHHVSRIHNCTRLCTMLLMEQARQSVMIGAHAHTHISNPHHALVTCRVVGSSGLWSGPSTRFCPTRPIWNGGRVQVPHSCDEFGAR